MIPFVVFVAALVVVALLLHREDQGLPGNLPGVPTPPGAKSDHERTPLPDPFAYDPERKAEFERRAAAGTAPPALRALAGRRGGDRASASRAGARRSRRAAKQAGVDPDRLEALVFLESAGRDGRACAGRHRGRGRADADPRRDRPRTCSGMQVDLAAQRAATRAGIDRALRARARCARSQRCARARAKVDERFDPAKALAGTARYLQLAQRALRARGPRVRLLPHGHRQPPERPARLRRRHDVATPQLYFDSTPLATPPPTRSSPRFGDDSSNYYWKLGAAQEIMRLSATTRPSSRGSTALQTAKDSAEEVLHPPGSTPRFATPASCKQAWDDEQIVAFPQDERVTGLRARRRAWASSRRCQPAALPRPAPRGARDGALHRRPGARDLASASPLIVTSTVRDERLPAPARGAATARRPATTRCTRPAGRSTSRARYARRRQALAFQFVLDRLQVLDVIAWVREPGAIHVTVSRRTRRRCSRCSTAEYNPPDDRRHPHARRAARGPARLPVDAALPHRSTGCGSRTSTRATARPVVMWHGEPTWSFLWRKVAAAAARRRPPRDPARPAGLRPLGQADGRATGTPTTATSRSRRTLLEDLDLRDATFVVHDWGGPIGLRLAVEHPDRVDAARDHGHRPVHRRAADERRLARFRDFVERTEDLPVGLLVRRGCHTDPGDEVAAAYDAPFPSEAREGRRARVPGLILPTPDAPGRGRGQARARRRCASDQRPTLMLWGDAGPGAAAAGRRGVRERARAARAPP